MAAKWWQDRSWWTAVAGGAIAFPIGVLLHELGHFGRIRRVRIPRSGPALRLCRLGR